MKQKLQDQIVDTDTIQIWLVDGTPYTSLELARAAAGVESSFNDNAPIEIRTGQINVDSMTLAEIVIGRQKHRAA